MNVHWHWGKYFFTQDHLEFGLWGLGVILDYWHEWRAIEHMNAQPVAKDM